MNERYDLRRDMDNDAMGDDREYQPAAQQPGEAAPEKVRQLIAKANLRLPLHYQERSDAYTHIVRGQGEQFIIQFHQDDTGQAEARARLFALAVNRLESALSSEAQPDEYCVGLTEDNVIRVANDANYQPEVVRRILDSMARAGFNIVSSEAGGEPQPRTPEQNIIFQEGRLLGLTEGMHKCNELMEAADAKRTPAEPVKEQPEPLEPKGERKP